MNHVSVSIWWFDRKIGFQMRNIFCSFFFFFFVSRFDLHPCELTASHILQIALIPLLKNNRKTFGKDPVQTVWELLNSLLSSWPFSLSEECLAQQIPISSTTLMILIASVIMYWSVLCVGVCCIHHYLFFTSLQALNTSWIQSELEFVKVSFLPFGLFKVLTQSPTADPWAAPSEQSEVKYFA